MHPVASQGPPHPMGASHYKIHSSLLPYIFSSVLAPPPVKETRRMFTDALMYKYDETSITNNTAAYLRKRKLTKYPKNNHIITVRHHALQLNDLNLDLD